MNREILFRGFHEDVTGKTVITVDGKKKRGEWVEGYAIEKWAGKDQPRRFAIDPCLRFDETGWCSWEDDIHLVIPSTVGQFTGLCDKNGKRIFEGDIFEVEWHGWKCVVEWEPSTVRFLGFTIENERKIVYVDMVDKNKKSVVEVTSNIFENSDLIGDENDA